MKNKRPFPLFNHIFKLFLSSILLVLNFSNVFAQIFIPNASVPNPINISTLPPGEYYNNQKIVLSPGFVAAPTGTNSYRFYISNGSVPLNAAPSQNQNYIITYIPKISGITNTSMLANKNTDQLMESIAYFDGLGRASQTVQVKGSPASHDIVQPVFYDQYGKESIKYLPYVLANSVISDGSFKPNAISDQSAFYNPASPGASGVATTNFPFSQTVFELSPLNRSLEQGAPGNDWQPIGTLGTKDNVGHTVKTTYGTNGTNEVKLWQLNTDGSQGAHWSNTYYAPSQLSKVTITNENGNYSIEFKDKNGLVICRQVQGVNNIIETSYVYDDLNNLTYVIPPAPQAALPQYFTENDNFFKAYLYAYHFDLWNRLIEKKMPGQGFNYIVYNNLDQIIFTQDANQQLRQEVSFIKYDALGRVIMTGIESGHSESRADLQNTVNGILNAGQYPLTQWELRDPNGANGYTNTSIPYGPNTVVLKVNYYDDYNFPSGNSTYAYAPNSQITGMPLVSSSMTDGLMTATKTAVLNVNGNINPDMLWAVSYYDDQARVIQTYAQHYLGGIRSYNNYDQLSSGYDFSNEITQTLRLHYNTNGVTPAVTVMNNYVYDAVGRKLKSFEQINGAANVLISQNDYNEIGQELTRHLHSTDNGSTFLQNIGYSYNERGWLMNQNSAKFNLNLAYNSGITTGANPQWNGNIAEMYTTSDHTAPNSKFKYTYDVTNRLIASEHYNNTLTENGIQYDDLGNLLTLQRSGASAANLSYTYDGNHLTTVSNNGSIFRTYNYDPNGNATTDGINKQISYNLFDLPQIVINMANNGTLATYTYDATGDKIRNAGNDETWDYIKGIVYHNGIIDFIDTEEGRAIPNGGSNYSYQYNLKDHLGNVRVSMDNTSVLQEDEYYAFGLRNGKYDASNNNRYLYNGKEIQTVLINQYDYGARFYDPVIGRMTSIDPKAELDRRFSPFVYGNNNPIRFIDPDGMLSTDVTENSDGTYKVVAAKADGDKRVYMQNADGQRTGQVIGQTVTDHSFLGDNGKAVVGATINLSDKSGQNFLNNLMGDKSLGLFDYMANATGGGKYDFKTTGPGGEANWMKGNVAKGDKAAYSYRGGTVDGVPGLSSGGGLPTIASARDIGNIGAGFVAGRDGMSWGDARNGFDLLQSKQQGQIATEGQTTQLAERLGYGLGQNLYKAQHPFKSLFKIEPGLPLH